MHPAPPVEHAHAGHPTLRAIARAVRDGRTVWTVKELADVFPGMSPEFFRQLTKNRLESTAHSTGRNGKAAYRISTRSVIAYFVQTTSGLTQAEIIECMALLIRSGLSRAALNWLRGAIDRQLAQVGTMPEIHLPGEPTPATPMRRASAADAHPTLFDLNPVVEPQATPSQHAA